MANVKVLTLTTERQVNFRLCGPAAIRMILSRFGLLYAQPSLWTDVQNNSGGTVAVNGTLPTTLLFAKQVCHLCGNWFCWFTTPEAMAKTLSDLGPVTVAARAIYAASDVDSLSAQLDSLLRPVPYPAATTVYAANHWVVVAGYHLDDPSYAGAPMISIGSRQVNGVHWADPADIDDDPPVVEFLATDAWLRMHKSIDCGPHTNTNPTVVGADPQNIIFKWWLYVVIWIKRWPPWPWNRKQIERPRFSTSVASRHPRSQEAAEPQQLFVPR